MLLIISDLHLTDGTSGTTIGPRAFKVFKNNLGDLAYEASFSKNSEGKTIYKPIKSIDLILLGDILDVIRSSKWLDATVRPWDDSKSTEFIEKIKKINQGILDHNQESLATLRSLKDGRNGGITLPISEDNAPKKDVGHHCDAEGRTAVEVNLYYLVGNHDWFYHLEGEAYDEIRQTVIDTIGLSNPINTPFPHDPSELPALIDIYNKYKIFARHGDIFDPFNFTGDRNKSSLGDAIVVELLNRFPNKVQKDLTEKYQNKPTLLKELAPCFQGLKETDNVRPLLYIPIWVDGLLERTCKNHPEVQEEIKEIWNALCNDFLKIPFVKSFDKWWNPIDDYDQLELGLKFSQHLSFDRISKLITTFKQNDKKIESYSKDALTEQKFKDRSAKFIVYGHTHYSEVVALDSVMKGEEHFGQIYINSGTWRQAYQLTKADRHKQTFLGYQVMTYLSFYDGEERKGREFEVWNGTLG